MEVKQNMSTEQTIQKPDAEVVVTEAEMNNILDEAFPSIESHLEHEEPTAATEAEENPGDAAVTPEPEEQTEAAKVAAELYKQMRDDLIGKPESADRGAGPQVARNPILDIPDEDLTVEQLVVKTQLKSAEYVQAVIQSREIVDKIFENFEVPKESRDQIDGWVKSANPDEVNVQSVTAAAQFLLGQGLSTGAIKVRPTAPPPKKTARSVASGLQSKDTGTRSSIPTQKENMAPDERAFRRQFGDVFSEEEIATMFK